MWYIQILITLGNHGDSGDSGFIMQNFDFIAHSDISARDSWHPIHSVM